MAVSEPVSPYRLVVFDWDGTLMDSAASIVDCMRRSLTDLGFEVPPENVIRGTIGLGLDSVLARLCPDRSSEERLRVRERYRHYWLTGDRVPSRLFAGARPAVEALAERGHLLAVATGKGRQGLDLDLESSGLGELFLATRTVDEARSKPDPQMLLELMDELGARPAETLMVGDASYDLQMARHAGVASVGVLTGIHRREELERWGPVACLEEVGQLPGWLDV